MLNEIKRMQQLAGIKPLNEITINHKINILNKNNSGILVDYNKVKSILPNESPIYIKIFVNELNDDIDDWRQKYKNMLLTDFQNIFKNWKLNYNNAENHGLN